MISLNGIRKLAHSREREDGLTILELLVVIAIIGIITAIAIPVFSVQRKKAADTSIRSDLQSVAQTYYAWQTSGNKTNKDFYALSGNQTGMIVKAPGASTTLPYNNWNDFSQFPVQVSQTNTIEIVVRTSNREGAFCLVASGRNSQWNYASGSGQHVDYNKILYFDSEAGGVKTMDELIALKTNGSLLACDTYVTTYRTAANI